MLPINPEITVVIIFKRLDRFVIECIRHCLALNYDNYRIMLIPDNPIALPDELKDPSKVIILPSGELNIPGKRNFILPYLPQKTQWIAFIDSDAYPDRQWLQNAVKYLRDKNIIALGGPNLSVPADGFSRKITGYILEQELVFGQGAIRHKIAANRFINELPTCNFIIHKPFFSKNPFNEELLTGEDAELCSRITHQGYQILYAGDVRVYHHRRRLFYPFIFQIYNYGYDKGFLTACHKIKPAYYLLPSFFLIFQLILFTWAFISPIIQKLFLGLQLVYGIIFLISTMFISRNALIALLAPFIIYCVHLCYGYGFLRAMIEYKVKKKNRLKRHCPANFI